eukprot:scaffold31949_cov146-Isochrysis_galbana.AAC.5
MARIAPPRGIAAGARAGPAEELQLGLVDLLGWAGAGDGAEAVEDWLGAHAPERGGASGGLG